MDVGVVAGDLRVELQCLTSWPHPEVRRGIKHQQDDGIFYGMEGDSLIHLLLMSRVFCRKFSIYLR